MDDGKLDFLNQELFSSQNAGVFPSNCSFESLFDEFLKDTHACTHTHTCNPPGPDYDSHTHSCFHVHTKIVPAPNDQENNFGIDEPTAESAEEKKTKKHPLGNRDAVRKYREKKKARAASIEDEVERLRTLNQQLLKKLQGQGMLEAEIVRLKCLLVDIRGRIDGEIGSFPYQKSVTVNAPSSKNHAYVMNPCKIGEDDAANEGFGACEFENLQCLMSSSDSGKELSGC